MAAVLINERNGGGEKVDTEAKGRIVVDMVLEVSVEEELVLSPSPLLFPAASGSATAVTSTSPAITALPPVDTITPLPARRSGRVSGSMIRERVRKELR